ncbi:MAG: xanthine phosphoribosyltransferase [Pseudobdellovibrionaceae bacterium]|jgi:xanthine phosphoribosyltransferase|nr:xanthine phosphoribosyltransferase [Pseudobdellovibrionaceae bacterium]
MPIDLPVSWQEIHCLSKKLTSKLRASGQSWNTVIAVTRGGMVPACLVARDLDIRVIETVCVESYAHQDQSEAKILYAPQNLGTGKGCLIVDDLSDTGNTFKALRKAYPDATYVCLHVKPKGKPLADFYADETTQDTWIYLPWEDQDFPPHIMERIGAHLV